MERVNRTTSIPHFNNKTKTLKKRTQNMWHLLPYIAGGLGIFVVFSCLGYFIYLTVRLHYDILFTNRQSNNCAQGNETRRDNHYNDIFFIEPNSQEAARIRAQLEKDDKDLPSYDEVMRIASLPTPTTVPTTANFIPATPSALTMGASGSSANINDTILPLPPFREAVTNLRPLTPPPYTPEPIGSSVVLPIAAPLHSQQNTHSI